MKISVIGCGYLGAVHAACMASLGHDVIGVDIDADKVAKLNRGDVPFFEPGLEQILQQSLASGRLRFAVAPATDELVDVDVHFVTVGTPQSATSGAADLSFVNSAFDMIEAAVKSSAKKPVVVGKSTVPVGTAHALAKRIAPLGLTLVWNPEFLRESFAVEDTLRPDRIVYGLSDDPAHAAHGQSVLDEIYASMLAAGIPRLVMNYPTAELVKVAANSFLATKISFINAMAELCEATGGDVVELAHALGHDVRIGNRFLSAGVGFGGGCLPKDIRAFVSRAEELGVEDAVGFLREVDEINQRRRDRVVDLSFAALGGAVAGKKITVLGAAFKPNSDDIRDSPALDVALRLHEHGAQVTVTDPEALGAVEKRFPQLRTQVETMEALKGADLVLLLTEWDEYKNLDPAVVRGIVAHPKIIDGRNVLDAQAWKAAGWGYRGLGRH
ncbi:MAG: UDP-glucose/GDP-mannose dehydrogenase family protein [Corynebacterium sp.]|uniref:UDP-glucose dehydrogenase family protein n=1 Tax=Corynebacterium sp. TaxID=1720 RepID=UPI0026DC0638|nr:UDP-glucose/GDP-mannose dehydrogenase family protein [Corynebacterium sp.]MDO4760910.1 UDP-glucose/GDP-mannose dehydrogenase family protein [Corynebacterium sp.]